MNKRTLKKLTAIGLSVSMLAGSLSVIPVKAEESAGQKVTADIYPVPQETEYFSEEGMKLEGTVNLVIHGEQDEATVTKVKQLLKEHGIVYQEAEKADEEHASILITSDKNHCADCSSEDVKALREEQGYVLNATDNENPKGSISIIGADKDGAYYGVMTLAQILDQTTADGKFAEGEIRDYPNIKLRGYVEGFYGYPWSFEDRLSLMSDTSKYKMNTYIYAPKDDPYHKDQWRTLYPAEKAEELRQLALESKKDNVSFCWNIHPGKGYNYSNDTDYNYLIAKFQQLYDLGVRQFGLSYDDLEGYANGRQQAELINRVNREFVKAKGDVEPLIVVGTRYCNAWGPSMQTYFEPFFSTLDEDVVVMWTGASTMSAITKEAYEWPKQQTGVNRNLAAWWNYPVNDYCDGKLLMSPLENLENDVDNLSGFFLNPMSQAEASKVAIFSGADYSWNVPAFEKMSSWKRAIRELVPDANDAFERFADNLSFVKDGFEFDESRYLTEKITALNDALTNGKDVTEAASALKKEFEIMRSDAVRLRAIENKEMFEDIRIFIDAYDVLAEAGIASMEAFIAAQEGDIETTLARTELLKEKLEQTNTFKIESLEGNGVKQNIVNVGEKRLKPMIRDSADQIQSLLSKEIMTEIELKTFSSDSSAENLSVAEVGGNYAVSEVDVNLESDGYFGFNLPKAMRLSEIIIDSDQNEKLEIQYSLNGIEWIKADAEISDGVLKTTGAVGAAYIRIVNKGKETVAVHIHELKAMIVYSLGQVTAATDLGTYQNYDIQNAVDGNMNTKFYSSSGSTAGSYVRVDLGKAIPLYDLTIYYAPNPKGISEGVDGFKKTKLEVSADAVTWKQIGDIIPFDEYTAETVSGQNVATVKFNAEGEMARYIRFSAAEAYDNWVQVYEVKYNQTVSNIGNAGISLVDADFTVQNPEYLYDGDFSTAMTAEAVQKGKTVVYKTTTITDIEKLTIIQNPSKICNADVSVKTAEGKWKEIGVLDQQITHLPVNDVITEIKLTFKNDQQSLELFEIVALEKKEKPELVNPFQDVKEDAYYYQPVLWAANAGIVKGVGDTGLFMPDQNCTRAHVVTFLWRQAGSPKAEGSSSFLDVSKDDYFYDAVMWAEKEGITKGSGNTGKFKPYDDCTRAHVVTFLWRAAKEPQIEEKIEFTDVAEDAYFVQAMKWAVKNNITNGMGNTGLFMPDGICTRAHAVTFMYRAAGRPLE